MTLTIIYPKDRFMIEVVSNFLPQIQAILGDFALKYRKKTLFVVVKPIWRVGLGERISGNYIPNGEVKL